MIVEMLVFSHIIIISIIDHKMRLILYNPGGCNDMSLVYINEHVIF